MASFWRNWQMASGRSSLPLPETLSGFNGAQSEEEKDSSTSKLYCNWFLKESIFCKSVALTSEIRKMSTTTYIAPRGGFFFFTKNLSLFGASCILFWGMEGFRRKAYSSVVVFFLSSLARLCIREFESVSLSWILFCAAFTCHLRHRRPRLV